MRVTALDDSVIHDIGHAFGYYDYGQEQGLLELFPDREAVVAFISGYVEMAMESGMLYATDPDGAGYIAYQLPGQKLRPRAMLPMAKRVFGAMTIRELLHCARVMAQGGAGLDRQLKKKKIPYIYVGMVCVREPYQGRGYMRKVMEAAFAEGNRLGVPVILDTDARSKCEKYVHLGMELAGTRRMGRHGVLYDLVKYPDGWENKRKFSTEGWR